jgi:hypothetical protein
MHDTALLLARHEAGTLEDRDVFHEAGERHFKRLRQLAGGRATARQASDDGAPCRVGQCRKGGVECSMVNHLV